MNVYDHAFDRDCRETIRTQANNKYIRRYFHSALASSVAPLSICGGGALVIGANYMVLGTWKKSQRTGTSITSNVPFLHLLDGAE
jgi:hypothetical protein